MVSANSACKVHTQSGQKHSRSAAAKAAPKRPRRRGRAARERRHCRVLSAVFAVMLLAGIIVEGTKIAHIVSVNRSIRAVTGENQVLENRVESLNEQIKLETREDVIAHYAQNELGMIRPTASRVYALSKPAQDYAQTAQKP